jgi:HlyD family secretion protein
MRSILALILLAACSSSASPNLIANGTVEVTETDAAAMVPARVVGIRVDEGAAVAAGDTLATLTQATTQAEIAQAAARVGSAEAVLRDLRAGARPAELRAAEAEVAAAEAEATRTAADLARNRPLAERGVLSRQSLDAAVAAADRGAARRRPAAAQLQLARQGARPEQLRAAEAAVASARADLAARHAAAADLVLTATTPGVVLRRLAEPGEVVPAGMPVLTLGDLRRPWARVYVAQEVARALRVGSRAEGTLDGLPARIFPGRVVTISDRAEFTPRIALTERERADLVFGVKVAFDDTTGVLHPGLPVTVRFPPLRP